MPDELTHPLEPPDPPDSPDLAGAGAGAATAHPASPAPLPGESGIAILGTPGTGKTVLMARLVRYIQQHFQQRLTLPPGNKQAFMQIQSDNVIIENGSWPERTRGSRFHELVFDANVLKVEGVSPTERFEVYCPDFAGEWFTTLFGKMDLIHDRSLWDENFPDPAGVARLVDHISRSQTLFLLVDPNIFLDDNWGQRTSSGDPPSEESMVKLIDELSELRLALAGFAIWSRMQSAGRRICIVLSKMDLYADRFRDLFPHYGNGSPWEADFWQEFFEREYPDLFGQLPEVDFVPVAAVIGGGNQDIKLMSNGVVDQKNLPMLAEKFISEIERSADEIATRRRSQTSIDEARELAQRWEQFTVEATNRALQGKQKVRFRWLSFGLFSAVGAIAASSACYWKLSEVCPVMPYMLLPVAGMAFVGAGAGSLIAGSIAKIAAK